MAKAKVFRLKHNFCTITVQHDGDRGYDFTVTNWKGNIHYGFAYSKAQAIKEAKEKAEGMK